LQELAPSEGEQVDPDVDGVTGTWRVDPALVGQRFTGRAALLSPFDRMLHDRERMAELFEYDYALEMYKPRPHDGGVTTRCLSSTMIASWASSTLRGPQGRSSARQRSPLGRRHQQDHGRRRRP